MLDLQIGQTNVFLCTKVILKAGKRQDGGWQSKKLTMSCTQHSMPILLKPALSPILLEVPLAVICTSTIQFWKLIHSVCR